MHININGEQVDVEFRKLTLIEDPSMLWTLKPGEYFVVITSPGKFKNKIWHSHMFSK